MMLWLLLISPAPASERFAGHQFYIGDLHAHTGLSGDGGSSDLGSCTFETCGALADVADTARGYGLDFVSITDHVNGGNVAEAEAFNALHQQMLDADDPDAGFVTIPGAELLLSLGTDAALGHYNLHLFGDTDALAGFSFYDAQVSCDRPTIEACDALQDFMGQLTARFGPALLLPHHPAAALPMPSDWSCTADAYTPAVEVYSEHGGALYDADPYDPPWSGYKKSSTVHKALDPDEHGLTLGFFASTDTHDTLPGDVCTSSVDQRDGDPKYGGGLAVVVLDEGETFDRGAVYEALVERRTYATSGPLIPVVAEYFSGGEPVGGMGEKFTVPDDTPFTVVVSVPPELAAVVLSVALNDLSVTVPLDAVDDGKWALTLDEPPAVFYPVLTIDGEAWYGEAGCDDGGEDSTERIWLSPSWVVSDSADAATLWPETGDIGDIVDTVWGEDCLPEEEAKTGCGCGATPHTPLWTPLLLLGLLVRREVLR